MCQLQWEPEQGCDTVAPGGAPHVDEVSLVQQVTGRANSGFFCGCCCVSARIPEQLQQLLAWVQRGKCFIAFL